MYAQSVYIYIYLYIMQIVYYIYICIAYSISICIRAQFRKPALQSLTFSTEHVRLVKLSLH